ncbi:MAG: glycosyltransferase family 4 protein [Phycisphaerales bacterium]|nr:MAG: glycosyltransferase family 4 protein [Phycisphaerales bacterium]
MNIAFFGWVKACDPMRVGGCESVIRRLAVALSRQGHTVAVVMYGADRTHAADDFFGDGVILKYHRFFAGALRELDHLKYDVVVDAYLHKRYHAIYLAFKSWNRKKTKFFAIFMAENSNSVKHWLSNTFRPMFCRTVFAVSPSYARRLQDCGVRAVWLPPPVPDCYFTFPRRVSGRKNVVVSFLGRIDPNKGLYELSSAFEALSRESHFSLRIRGYYVPEDSESVKLHTKLQRLAGVDYSAEPHCSHLYEPSNEREVLRYLSETDILTLPYRNLRGTLQLPLLVLEGLAAGCIVMSRDVGDIAQFIGCKNLIIHDSDDLRKNVEGFSTLEAVEAKRAKIDKSALYSTFALTKVVDRLVSYL